MRSTRGVILALAVMTAAFAAIPPLSPARAEDSQVRSGTIVGGAGVELGGGQPWEQHVVERSGCEYAADCRVWLDSGCNPALAGIEPALTASIVDVSDLAEGTNHVLRMTSPRIPPWGLYPGVVVQFWRQDCTEIDEAKLHSIGSSPTCKGYVGAGFGWCVFPIPVDATWMSLSAYVTTVHLTWTIG